MTRVRFLERQEDEFNGRRAARQHAIADVDRREAALWWRARRSPATAAPSPPSAGPVPVPPTYASTGDPPRPQVVAR